MLIYYKDLAGIVDHITKQEEKLKLQNEEKKKEERFETKTLATPNAQLKEIQDFSLKLPCVWEDLLEEGHWGQLIIE